MKRVDLIRHLVSEGCTIIREGGDHTILRNPVTKKSAPVPRHREVADLLCHKICGQLGVRSTKPH